MSEKQIWQTIALDLKRGANYLHFGRVQQAQYYLDEAKKLYESLVSNKMSLVRQFIKFDGNPEEVLLGSTFVTMRI